MLGFPVLYFKGTRIMMYQLSEDPAFGRASKPCGVAAGRNSSKQDQSEQYPQDLKHRDSSDVGMSAVAVKTSTPRNTTQF